MEPTIRILAEELCNKIAAGEVVERPSSVVKELLENSLDAGATSITVDLEAGGKRLIRVEDNGCGMHRQDAFLSFERHATSKIRSDQDLFALTSLGFRGEALASIASVARLWLKTCAGEDGQGTQIYVEGGRIKRADEIGLPRGTAVEVRNLFFNLPARKKFLRKEQTELGHAADVVTKQALAHPQVSFRLRHNERTLFDLRRETGLRERVANLLGRSLLRDLQELDAAAGDDLQLQGLISQPQLNRSAASHIYTFVNGRYIRDRVVQHAVMEGYRHLLMKGRYPVVVLFLRMDPAQVDVNVHPTKHEVRFRQQAQVHDFITSAIQQALRPASWVEQNPPEIDRLPPEDQLKTFSAEPRYEQRSSPDAGAAAGMLVRETTADSAAGQTAAVDPRPAPLEPQQDDLPGSRTEGFFSALQIIGQYHRSYILCQDGDDLVMIDQHAAHERVGFERLRLAYAEGSIPSQALLFPEVLELDFNAATALQENLETLALLGFEIEPFGGRSFALKAVPQLLSGTSVKDLVIDVALELERIGDAGRLRDSLDEVLIMMACHSVIRANQSLTSVEIKALFAAMDGIDFNANCPHGRPVLQRLTLTEVERLFRRQ
jgi:DNA mismatch repair protein MutL